MNTTPKQTVVASPELPEELAALFAKAPQIDATQSRELAAAAQALDRDPQFVAEYLKGMALEDILRAMEETGVTQTELANRIGKSRQYVSNVLKENSKANFTLDTLAYFAVALRYQPCVRILPPTQQMHVFGTVAVKLVPAVEFASEPEAPGNVIDFAECVNSGTDLEKSA
jgi:transcriptional regulator with XRE-family HTH domain